MSSPRRTTSELSTEFKSEPDLASLVYTELFPLPDYKRRLREAYPGRRHNDERSEQASAAPGIGNYRYLPDVEANIPSFTGNECNSAADDWILAILEVAEEKNWTDTHAHQFARGHLDGPARIWALCEKFYDWEDFVKKFNHTFVIRECSESDRRFWQKLDNRYQDERESTISYFFAKVGLCRPLNLTFNEIKSYVLKGLCSRKQAQWIASRNHTGQKELLKDLEHYEKLQNLGQRKGICQTLAAKAAEYKAVAGPFRAPLFVRSLSSTSAIYNSTQHTEGKNEIFVKHVIQLLYIYML